MRVSSKSSQGQKFGNSCQKFYEAGQKITPPVTIVHIVFLRDSSFTQPVRVPLQSALLLSSFSLARHNLDRSGHSQNMLTIVFDLLPHYVDIFYLINVDKKSTFLDYLLTPLFSLLVNVVSERPLQANIFPTWCP